MTNEIKEYIDALHSDFVHTSGFYNDANVCNEISSTKRIEMDERNEQEKLMTAIDIANRAHYRQFDKCGRPYILHPLHLMSQLLFDTELATIAVLHDVAEDSDLYTLEGLSGVFNSRVMSALNLLTHKDGDDYLGRYIPKICTNYDAIRVKRKDLKYNMDITRIKVVTDKDLERIDKYHLAFMMLGAAKCDFKGNN